MIAGKTIAVTGASSGIGRATADHLLAHDAHVVAIGRNVEKMQRELDGKNVTIIQADLWDLASYATFVERMPSLDGVVHSAGMVENNPIRFFSLEKYERTITLNQTAPLVLLSELLRRQKLNKNGSIVLVSSINGNSVAIKGCAAYAASKAALTGIAKVIALELAPRGIRCNCVQPGMVATPMIADLAQTSESTTKADMARYPLGQRYATATEIATVVKFLLSSDSSFVTGQSVIVDGAYSIQ